MNLTDLHVVVQAGGRGSRLRHHTWNKPKCLVSVRGKPLLYHLFDRFKGARFTVIGDYCYDQLERYMVVNPPGVTYTLVKASGAGTASGIAQALTGISDECPLLLVWSDLIIGELPQWPVTDDPVIGITNAFTCRWSTAEDGRLVDTPSSTRGVPGLFYFPRKSLLPTPPSSGEFVRWLSTNLGKHETLMCPSMTELGDFTTIETENDAAGFSRFFNRVTVGEDTVEKVAIDPAYTHLIENELRWYEEVQGLGFRRIPRLLNKSPMTMQRIHGEHLYRINDLTKREQRAVFADYLDALNSLHDMGTAPTSVQDVFDVYHEKTISRVSSVSSLIPGFERKSVTVNGKKCKNVFHPDHISGLRDLVGGLVPKSFSVTHGDATFSNTLVDDKLRVWFIDPRGYFSKKGVMGDPWYDFAKVYYSAVGGYDAFNRRKFKLHVDDETVEVLMQEPLYAQTAEVVFAHYFGAEMQRIRTIHGLIWLALSGYAKDDIDSVIGSFYLGLYWLEDGNK
jgi:aminoglycoside phosphotransferase